MAGLLLLWLLVYAPLAPAESPTLVLSEMCYHPINLDYLQLQLGNTSLKIAPSEGKITVVLSMEDFTYTCRNKKILSLIKGNERFDEFLEYKRNTNFRLFRVDKGC